MIRKVLTFSITKKLFDTEIRILKPKECQTSIRIRKKLDRRVDHGRTLRIL